MSAAIRTLPEGLVGRAGGADEPQAPELVGGVPDDALPPQAPGPFAAGGVSREFGSPHPDALLQHNKHYYSLTKFCCRTL